MNLDSFKRWLGGDPLKLGRVLWPDVHFFDKQREIVQSVRDNFETYVPAGNMLGKDFTAGFVALTCFLLPELYMAAAAGESKSEVRIITTSVKDDHLRVLWGEIGRFLQSARKDTPVGPLHQRDGGLLIVNHRDIRKMAGGREDKISYLRGMVSERGEGCAGHHAAHTLAIIDEASGVDDVTYTQLGTWAKRMLVIGNPNACQNFFFRNVQAGDLLTGVEVKGASHGQGQTDGMGHTALRP